MKLLAFPTSFATLLAITVTVNATTFDDWRVAFFSPAQLTDPLVSGPNADPDKDGVRNYSEFVVGTDPWLPMAEPLLAPQFTLDPGTSLFHFTALFHVNLATEGAMFVAQVTENLGTRWRADQIELRGNGYIADGRYEYLAVDRISSDLPEHRFIRLLIAADADQDGMPDDWEIALGMNPNDPFDSMGDSDGDGDSNLVEFLHGTDPLNANDNRRRDEIPRAPRNVSVVINSDGSRDVVWDDVSDNEQFFVIFGTDGSGNKVELGRVGPNLTRFHLPAGY